METSSLICCANQWSGFYMIGTSIMKELNQSLVVYCELPELRFCEGSNPVRGVSEICNGDDL